MDPDVFGAPLPNPIGNFSAQAMDAALDQFKFGSAAIASISALSALMVGFLIIQLIVVTFCPKGRKKGEDGTPIYVERAFLKTHLGMYVFCLLVTNLASALGGILQAAWAIRTAMGQDLQQSGAMSALLWDFGTCQAQGWLTQIGDVGSAIWTVVMGLHSFRTLVLHRYLTFRGVAIALVIGWFLTFFFAFAGPLIALGNGASFYGPVFAEDGPLWCWTYYPYAQFQFWFNSLFTLLSALSSVVLYTLTFVILRYRRKGGDGVVKYGGCFSPRYEAWLWIAVKKMLAYPLAYVILIMPLTLCRLLELSGYSISSLAFLISFAIFSLTGFVNGLILIWASKVLQTKQWKVLIDYWWGRTPISTDIESSPPTVNLYGDMSEEKQPERMSAFSHMALRIPRESDPAERPQLPPLITQWTGKQNTPGAAKDEGLGRNGSVDSNAARHSAGSRRTMSTFFSETPLVSLPPARPLVTRKPVPPIIPKRSSLRTKLKRFSTSVTDRLKTIEGTSPIEEPSTSILSRFPLPPLLERLTEVEASMQGPKRGSKSAPTSPRPNATRVWIPPGGPRSFRTLPAHPAVFRQPATSDATPHSPTPVDIVVSALRSDEGNNSDSDDSADSLRPLSAKLRGSWYSSSTIKARNQRRSRMSNRSMLTFVTARSQTATATTSTRGVAL